MRAEAGGVPGGTPGRPRGGGENMLPEVHFSVGVTTCGMLYHPSWIQKAEWAKGRRPGEGRRGVESTRKRDGEGSSRGGADGV